MYGLIVYDGKYLSDGRFLNILFGHKHKKAIRINIDFKEEKVVGLTLYQKQAGLDILDKVLLRWNFTLSNKVNRYVYAIKKSLV